MHNANEFGIFGKVKYFSGIPADFFLMESPNHIIPMSTTSEHTHQVRLRQSGELDMLTPRAARGGHPVDYDDKLEAAQRELERIQQEREELARKKRELDELNARKRGFVAQQNELAEKLGASLTKIDRTLFELREEAEDLEQCRSCFAAHLDKLEKINPEQWGADSIADRLERATLVLDAATDDFDSAAAHFSNSRSGAIFGQPSKRTRAKRGLPSEFAVNLRNGFAFNLPVIVLGSVALIVFLTR